MIEDEPIEDDPIPLHYDSELIFDVDRVRGSIMNMKEFQRPLREMQNLERDWNNPESPIVKKLNNAAEKARFFIERSQLVAQTIEDEGIDSLKISEKDATTLYMGGGKRHSVLNRFSRPLLKIYKDFIDVTKSETFIERRRQLINMIGEGIAATGRRNTIQERTLTADATISCVLSQYIRPVKNLVSSLKQLLTELKKYIEVWRHIVLVKWGRNMLKPEEDEAEGYESEAYGTEGYESEAYGTEGYESEAYGTEGYVPEEDESEIDKSEEDDPELYVPEEGESEGDEPVLKRHKAAERMLNKWLEK
jgi:hypothetical protein